MEELDRVQDALARTGLLRRSLELSMELAELCADQLPDLADGLDALQAGVDARRGDLQARHEELTAERWSRRCGCESAVCEDVGAHVAGSCPVVPDGQVWMDHVGLVCSGCVRRIIQSGGGEYLHDAADE